jgi:hypothetical protein
VAASHDGRFAAIGNYDGICEIYSIAERRTVHSIPHEAGIACSEAPMVSVMQAFSVGQQQEHTDISGPSFV